MSFSRRGRPLAEEEKSTDAAKARARAMELLAGQELSSGQLYERLGRKFTQPTAAAVVAEMVERQYVDDERYARTRAHGLLAARKSRRAAAQDLRQKGLDAQQISAALEEVYASDEAGGDPELEAAAALVEGRYRGKLAAGRKDLVVAALARRGFAYPIIKEAIKSFISHSEHARNINCFREPTNIHQQSQDSNKKRYKTLTYGSRSEEN